MNQRVVYVCFFPAYPPTSGAAAVTYHSARHTTGDPCLIQMGSEPGEQTTDEGLRVLTLAWPRGRVAKVLALGRRVSQVAKEVASLRPQVVVLEGASWAMYHWMLLKKLRQRCPSCEIWYHSHNVEYVLRQQKHGRLVTALTKWAEGRLVRRADRVFAVSEVDREQFRQLYGVDAELWPNGVDVGQFVDVSADEVAKVKKRYGLTGPTVLFMGMYAYRPNQEAVDFLVQRVMPAVVQARPGARLVVLGGQVPYTRDWLLAPGRVAHTDLPAIVRACGVGVAPIFSGSGTRLKILEYMAGGIPVVATPKGAEGLSVVDGQSLYLAEADDFPAAVVKALAGSQEVRDMADRGQSLVVRRYSWHGILSSIGLCKPMAMESRSL